MRKLSSLLVNILTVVSIMTMMISTLFLYSITVVSVYDPTFQGKGPLLASDFSSSVSLVCCIKTLIRNINNTLRIWSVLSDTQKVHFARGGSFKESHNHPDTNSRNTCHNITVPVHREEHK